MKMELRRMQSFLIDADRRRGQGDALVTNWVFEIQELAYDAEEVITTFVVKVVGAPQASYPGRRPPPAVCFNFKGCFSFVKTSPSRHVVGTEIQEINKKIVALRQGLQTYKVLEQAPTSTTTNPRMRYSTVVEDTVVGLEDHVTTVVTYLKDKTHPRVISIWGMGGLGKTTFAKEIYRHGAIRRYFDHVALVCVSQECNPNQVWRDVLLQFIASEEQKKRIRKLTPFELVRELESLQMEKKCLVILDDIWEQNDWTSLNDAFPRGTRTGSKIMLTTRNKAVVSRDHDIRCFPYNLPLLNKREGLELLGRKLSPQEQDFKMSTRKKKVMEEIVKHCGGLPLAIVLVSGVLAEDSSLEGCEKVCQDLSSSLNKGVWDVLALSYQVLPYHLKACFLYLSLFPEDHEIQAKSLVQMWIAEGFVSDAATTGGEGTKTTFDVGLSYLNELVNRCIVQANITKFTRKVRSCRLHDLMRDFCVSKAKEENFFAEFGLQQSFSGSPSNTIRRSAVYLHPGTTIPQGQYQHVRSCLVHGVFHDEITDPWDTINSLLKGFKFLKVFSLIGFPTSTTKGELSEEAMGKLIHLRCLIVPKVCRGLPSSLGNLILLQTLNLRRYVKDYCIPNVLWKLKELRHLYLPQIPNYHYKLRLDGLSKLETLVGFNTRISEIGDLRILPKLRKVHIQCGVEELDKVLESPMFSQQNSLLRQSTFIVAGASRTREEHILICQVSSCPHVIKLKLFGRVYEETFLFSLNAKITTLYLWDSGLKEDPMPTLKKIPNLRTLHLLKGSYTGKKMECLGPTKTVTETTSSSSSVSFPQLTRLQLDGLEICEWKVEQGAMPCLSRLDIKNCKELKEIPEGLRFIDTLERVEFINPTESLKQRLAEGRKDFHKIRHVPNIIIEDI